MSFDTGHHVARISACAACAVLIGLAAPPALGQCTAQQAAKLVASDAAAGDEFGHAVSVSGDTAMVGAWAADHPRGTDAGTAYVYLRSGATGREVWTQQARLIASDTAANDFFGSAVAVSGNTALVGAYGDSHAGGANAGSVYVFVRNGTTWTQQAKLTASDAAASDLFGVSVALSGDTALIGAYRDDHAGGINAGSAYVFIRNGTTWTQQAKLTASDASVQDEFGFSVALSGDTAAIGAHLDDHAGGSDAGSAYVFVRNGTTWTQQAKLTASDASSFYEFGFSVGASGDTVVVGSPFESLLAGVGIGSAYVFVRTGTIWSQQAKLVSFNGAQFDNFGYSVAASGERVVVGAWKDTHDRLAYAGSAYMFSRSGPVGGQSWNQQAKLTASDAAPGDFFGFSAAMSGDMVIVGAILDDRAGGTDSGSAYLYDLAQCVPCPGDLIQDGVVNGLDLVIVLGAWSSLTPYTPCPPFKPADLNHDCKVNGVDLALMLGAWGPCP